MDDNSHDTFFNLSRATIAFPLLIIICTLFFLWNKTSIPNSSIEKSTISPTPSSFNLGQIDLKGPLACSYSTADFNLEGFIKNKKVSAQIIEKKHTTFYTLYDDCLYSWKKGENNGQKKCGLSPYLATFDLIKNMSIPLPINTQLANNILSSCKKKGDINTVQFDVPKNIRFTEDPIQLPQVLM